jgi:glutamyl-tRNA synthetase
VFRDPPAMEEAAVAKFLVPENRARLRELAGVVERVEPWTSQAIEQAVEPWVATAGMQMKDVAQPARVALTGRTASPGLFDVIAVLGRERAVRRLRAGAEGSERHALATDR